MPETTSPNPSKPATKTHIPLISLKVPYNGIKLDKLEENYAPWARAMKNYLILSGFYHYVFKPPTKPSFETDPDAFNNWTDNDRLAAAIIMGATSEAEQDLLNVDDGAQSIWEALRDRHQNEGPIKQVTLLQKALSTKVTSTEPLMTTIRTICEAVNRAFSITNTIDCDLLKCIAILNALGSDQYSSARSIISSKLAESSKEKPYTSVDICKFLEGEQTLHANDHKNTTSTSIALAAQTNPPKSKNNNSQNIVTCTNCIARQRHGRGHLAKYCVQPGGGMAGKTIEESRAARLADQGKSPNIQGNSKKEGLVSVSMKDSQGRAMVALVDPKNLQNPQPEFAGLASTPLPTHSSIEEIEYLGFMAIEGEPRAKIDWNEHSAPVDESSFTTITPLHQSQRTAVSTDEHPFYVDSGATVHISPDRNDFQTLRAIPARSVKGVGGSAIVALGMGDIRLRIARGAYITLKDALYIPNSTVRLMSVSALSTTCGTAAIFDDQTVRIINKSTGALVASGPLISKKGLYSLTLHSAHAEHALSAQHTPNAETWHRRLGHANYRAISEMARNGMITE